MKDGVQLDQEHEFKGVTLNIISVQNLHSSVIIGDDAQFFVRIRNKQKVTETTKKKFHHDKIAWNQNFFYNTSQLLDDDIIIEVHYQIQKQGQSKKLTNQNQPIKDSSILIFGQTELLKISRQNFKQIKTIKTYTLKDPNAKRQNGKLKMSFQWFERQDIVGGIKCPNLSLRASQPAKSKLVLQNKITAYKNLYSFWDGYQNQQCQFFPKKFHH